MVEKEIMQNTPLQVLDLKIPSSRAEGPFCSVYTPGGGVKGDFEEGGSLAFCGLIPASKHHATGKPSKKYQKPSVLSVTT